MIETRFGKTTLRIVRGHLPEWETDAVVRETDADLNAELNPGGLTEAGGPALEKAIEAARAELGDDGLAIGTAVVSDAGDLAASAVIHTWLPEWKDRYHGEKIELERAYEKSLVAAIDNDFKTIAFPALGLGERGFPGYEATVIALNTIERVVTHHDRRTDYRGAIERVDLVVETDENFELYREVFEAYAHRWDVQKIGA